MKTAIVSGANGFVGKAVVNELQANGIKVFAIVRENDARKKKDDLIEYIQCDLENYDRLSQMLPLGTDIFYHFAWTGSAGILRGDENVQLANIGATCKAVETAAKVGCKKFAFASSIMEYEIAKLMKTEKKPPVSSLYSTAKITADYMARILAEKYGIEYVSCIISNIYGPGEMSPRLINTSIRKLLTGERVSLSPCDQLYDFIYITDAAKMFYYIGKDGYANKKYYIGNQRPRKLKEFMNELRDVVSPDTSLGFGDLKFDGISLTYNEFDTESVYKDTGFYPLVTFKQGIKNTTEWLKNQYLL